MIYHAYLRGEDNTEFTIEVEAADVDAAYDWVQDGHPEAHILEIFEPYERAQQVWAEYLEWEKRQER